MFLYIVSGATHSKSHLGFGFRQLSQERMVGVAWICLMGWALAFDNQHCHESKMADI
jgi:hypothetical protein